LLANFPQQPQGVVIWLCHLGFPDGGAQR
jgi:hypothetical protein